MPPLDQRVGRRDKRTAGGRREQCSIVAHAEQHVAAPRWAPEKPVDEVEFAERHGAPRSGARASRR